MFKIQGKKSFWGSGLELAEQATLCARELGIEGEKINLRLIRYYATEGVINRPDRLGKEAAYNYLHLLQLLVARKMVKVGTPLGTVRVFNHSASVAELEKALIDELSEEKKRVIEKVALDEQSSREKYRQKQSNKDLSEILGLIKNIETHWEQGAKYSKESYLIASDIKLETRRSLKILCEMTESETQEVKKGIDSLLSWAHEISHISKKSLEDIAELRIMAQAQVALLSKIFAELYESRKEMGLRIDAIEKKIERQNGI